MTNTIHCSYCKSSVDLTLDPIECHVCALGHPLCESCNHIARGYCFRCGGRTTRKLPDKDVKELYRASPNHFMKKIMESRTLMLPQESEEIKPNEPQSQAKTTVVGFRKFPRSFFNKVPQPLDKLTSNEKQFLEKLPTLIEDEDIVGDKTDTPAESKLSWDNLPKSFSDFELAPEVLECPISKCKYPICNTDAMRHLLQTHDDLPILSLRRNIIGEFHLDAKAVRKNEIKCATRILVPGVIKDLGITKHKDSLPIYLLFTRVNSSEAEEELGKVNSVRCATYSEEGHDGQAAIVMSNEELDDNVYAVKNPWRKHDCLVLWCAGVVPLDHPITIAITVSPKHDKTINMGGLVRVFSLHIPQSSHGIYSNTERLIISRHDLKRLTKTDAVIDGQICVL